MREHLGFLKVCCVIVKISAWISLFIGLVGGTTIIMGKVPGNPPWMGIFILGVYIFVFFFLYLVTKIADLLMKINNEIKKG